MDRIDVLEALAVARFFWGRLPRVDEWSQAVAGSAGFRFPWGDRFNAALRANTAELGLWRRARVGSFESGRSPASPLSCYDLVGNVAEWTLTPALAWWKPAAWEWPLFDSELALRDARRLLAWLGRWPIFDPVEPWIAAAPEWLRLSSNWRVDLSVVGRSFADRVLPNEGGRRLLYEEHAPLDSSSHIGMRMATDPFTFLALLAKTEGRPSAADRKALRLFLQEYREEFRAAALSLAESLYPGAGSAPPAGSWAAGAWQALGL